MLEQPFLYQKHYRIRTDQPLAFLSKKNCIAYAVDDSSDKGERLYAVIGDYRTSLRYSLVESFLHNRVDQLIQPCFQFVHDDSNKKRYLVLLFNRPERLPLWEREKQSHLPIDEFSLLTDILEPLLKILDSLHGRGVVHGSIDPYQIYGTKHDLCLGECITYPILSNTHPALQSFESLTVCEGGCDDHNFSLDIYSLGITIALLILGKNPWEGISKKDIIQKKTQMGSFNFVVHQQHMFSPRIKDFLRGVLNDNPSDRWKIKDISAWLSGAQIPAKNSNAIARSNRPYRLNEKEYHSLAPLIYELRQHTELVHQIINDLGFLRWVENYLKDFKTLKNLQLLYKEFKASENVSNDVKAIRFLLVLDPMGPLTWNGITFYLNGFSALLAHTVFSEPQNLEIFHQFFVKNIFGIYLSHQDHTIQKVDQFVKDYPELVNYCNKSWLGFGVEFALYTLNKFVPCQSPLFKDHMVFSLRDLLLAVNDLTNVSVNKPYIIFDRHIAAFLIRHNKNTFFVNIKRLNYIQAEEQLLQILKIYSKLQRQFGNPALVPLCKWFAESLQPLVNRFHNLIVREVISNSITKIAEHGDLSKIYELINDETALMQDEINFESAKKEYENLVHDEAHHHETLSQENSEVTFRCKELSLNISFLIAIVIFLGLNCAFFYKGLF